MILTIIYALVGFIVLVFFHELGHFVFAKIGKVAVEEFAVGMGKPLWKKKYRGTTYKICMIPFGGYCKLKGQDDFGPVRVSNDKNDFYSRPPYVRFFISFGGPLFSYILGFIFLFIALFAQGETKINYTKISVPQKNEILMDGDEILSIEGKETKYWVDIIKGFMENNKTNSKIKIKRDNKIIEVQYTPDFENKEIVPFTKNFLVLDVVKGKPADKAGIKPYDIILEVNGEIIRDYFDLRDNINKHTIVFYYFDIFDRNEFVKTYTSPIEIKILHKEKLKFYYFDFSNHKKLVEEYEIPIDFEIKKGIVKSKKINPYVINGSKLIGLGIPFGGNLIGYFNKQYINGSKNKFMMSISGIDLKIPGEKVAYGFGENFTKTFHKSYEMIIINIKGLGQLIKGKLSLEKNAAGPLRIFKILGETGSAGGFIKFLELAGIISILLAFFNLLPFPALDGGHMVISIIEMISRKRVNPKIVSVLQIIGITILLSLLVMVTILDIGKIF